MNKFNLLDVIRSIESDQIGTIIMIYQHKKDDRYAYEIEFGYLGDTQVLEEDEIELVSSERYG
jgi:hypothetical protein